MKYCKVQPCPGCEAQWCMHETPAKCKECGADIMLSNARWEGGSLEWCYGCCGWPFCSCPSKHEGDCQQGVTYA